MIQITNAVYLELHTFISQERISEFCCKWPCCCCMPLPLDATSFKNGFSTTKSWYVLSLMKNLCLWNLNYTQN